MRMSTHVGTHVEFPITIGGRDARAISVYHGWSAKGGADFAQEEREITAPRSGKPRRSGTVLIRTRHAQAGRRHAGTTGQAIDADTRRAPHDRNRRQ
jgi:hypothetical protein